MIISRLVRSGRSPCSCCTDEGLGSAVVLGLVPAQQDGSELDEETSEIGPVVIVAAATGSVMV